MQRGGGVARLCLDRMAWMGCSRLLSAVLAFRCGLFLRQAQKIRSGDMCRFVPLLLSRTSFVQRQWLKKGMHTDGGLSSQHARNFQRFSFLRPLPRSHCFLHLVLSGFNFIRSVFLSARLRCLAAGARVLFLAIPAVSTRRRGESHGK